MSHLRRPTRTVLALQGRGDWQRVKHVLASDAKLGLEALSNKYFSFITDEYLPRKLKEKRWLD